jgi:membrane protein YdbS with pleckstrin-like domain
MSFWEKFLGFNPNRERSFPGEQEGEKVIYMGVFHWIHLMPFFLKLSGVIGALILVNSFGLMDDFTTQTRFFLNSSAAVILLHVTCFRLYNYFLKVMLITNYRLIDIRHTVFLKREREVIPMSNIQDIRYQQNGILSRIFNYGDLIVLGSSSDVKYQFHYVPKANKLHHLLGEIHRKALRESPRSIRQEETVIAAQEPVQVN